MWIRLEDTLVNLDLILEITPVRKMIVETGGRIHGPYEYHTRRGRSDATVEELNDRRVQRLRDSGNFEGFMWEFSIRYLDSKRANKIIRGTDELAIGDARDELFLFVSGNQPNIPTIRMEGFKVTYSRH